MLIKFYLKDSDEIVEAMDLIDWEEMQGAARVPLDVDAI